MSFLVTLNIYKATGGASKTLDFLLQFFFFFGQSLYIFIQS